jgi:hypothetical protein
MRARQKSLTGVFVATTPTEKLRPSIDVYASKKIPDAAYGKRQPQWMKAITES